MSARPRTRMETLPIADFDCASCHGLGLREGKLKATEPCDCVLRAIFRECYARFELEANRDHCLRRVTLDSGTKTRVRRACWAKNGDEFIAEFMLLCKRTLDVDEHRLFRFHFLLSADWRVCCWRLALDKTAFFTLVSRIEQKMGRALRKGAVAAYGGRPCVDS